MFMMQDYPKLLSADAKVWNYLSQIETFAFQLLKMIYKQPRANSKVD